MKSKDNGIQKRKVPFSYKGLSCYIESTIYDEGKTKNFHLRKQSHVAVCDEIDFKTEPFESGDEAKRALMREIDEGLKDIGMNNSTTSIKKLPAYKGLECELKTTVFEKQPLNDPRRYSHVAMCDELGVRSRPYPDAASAVTEMKKLIDASMKDRDNSLSKKKLAVIKSNAKPEVKLKALEKLNSPKQNAPSLNELRKLAQSMISSIQSDVNMLQQGIDQMLQMTKKTQDPVELQSIIDDCKDIKNALGRVI